MTKSESFKYYGGGLSAVLSSDLLDGWQKDHFCGAAEKLLHDYLAPSLLLDSGDIAANQAALEAAITKRYGAQAEDVGRFLKDVRQIAEDDFPASIYSPFALSDDGRSVRLYASSTDEDLAAAVAYIDEHFVVDSLHLGDSSQITDEGFTQAKLALNRPLLIDFGQDCNISTAVIDEYLKDVACKREHWM